MGLRTYNVSFRGLYNGLMNQPKDIEDYAGFIPGWCLNLPTMWDMSPHMWGAVTKLTRPQNKSVLCFPSYPQTCNVTLLISCRIIYSKRRHGYWILRSFHEQGN